MAPDRTVISSVYGLIRGLWLAILPERTGPREMSRAALIRRVRSECRPAATRSYPACLSMIVARRGFSTASIASLRADSRAAARKASAGGDSGSETMIGWPISPP